MGSKASKSCATENMKQIQELNIEEKTRTDILLFNTLKDVIERVERLEETKSDKICYKLRPVSLCNYSIISLIILLINNITNLLVLMFLGILGVCCFFRVASNSLYDK